MAKVVQPFDGVPDGQVHPRRFEIGEQVLGDLARVAIAEGWAVEEAAKTFVVGEIGPDFLLVRNRVKAIADRLLATLRNALARARQGLKQRFEFTP